MAFGSHCKPGVEARANTRRAVQQLHGRAVMAGAATALRTFWNSPTGPKTTHFWGPVGTPAHPLRAQRLSQRECFFLGKRSLSYKSADPTGSAPQVANWGFVVAGAADAQKPAELISGNMTGGPSLVHTPGPRFLEPREPRLTGMIDSLRSVVRVQRAVYAFRVGCPAQKLHPLRLPCSKRGGAGAFASC